MRHPKQQFAAALILLSLLIAGCSQPAPVELTAADPTPAGARLSPAEVIRIAGDVAVKDGRDLADYHAPRPVYQQLHADEPWTVFYDGKVPTPGNHFLVDVDDRTRTARLMPGE